MSKTNGHPLPDAPASVSAYPQSAAGARECPPARRPPKALPAPVSAHQLARTLPPDSWRSVTWREGTKGPMTSRFAAVRVRPAHGYRHGEQGEEPQWLLLE